MAIKRCPASIDVVEAAKIRIRNVFRNGLPVYMSFSGGKDSLCMSQLVMNLIQTGEIKPAQLIVQFIDEEAIFPCMEEKVREWRKKFMLVGAKFEWFCLEVKHYNCFNELSNDETFICWDRYKKDVWVRQPPSFKDVWCASPLYDWTNNDVWLYLLREKVDIPEIYQFLWQSGTKKGQLRVSQFFSIDTAKSLVKMNEYYPDLMERIIRREPNAYLAALYWDSEMFGRMKREVLKRIIKRHFWSCSLTWMGIFGRSISGMWRTGTATSLWASLPLQTIRTARQSTRGLYREIRSCVHSGRCTRRFTGNILQKPRKRRGCRMDNKISGPLSTLRWVDRGSVKPNDYNPNKVSKQNLALLKQSILANGWTLPIVVRPDFTIVEHKDKAGNIYGTVTHNRARGTHLLGPMKAIVKELMAEGKSVEEIGKQLGMRPEEIFRLSEFSKEDFLKMMIKPDQGFSKAEFITKI